MAESTKLPEGKRKTISLLAMDGSMCYNHKAAKNGETALICFPPRIGVTLYMATEGSGKNYTNNSAFLAVLFLFLKACNDVIALKLWEKVTNISTALIAVYAVLFGLIFFVIFLLCSYSWFRLRALCCLGLAALDLALAAVWSLWLAAIVLVCAEILCFAITECLMRRFFKRRQQGETESK